MAVIIRIRCNLGLFRVNLDNLETAVNTVKEQLQAQQSISSKDYGLLKDGIKLDDDATLTGCGVKHGDMLTVEEVLSKSSNEEHGTHTNVKRTLNEANDENTLAGPKRVNPAADAGTVNGNSIVDVAGYGFEDEVYVMHETQDSSLCGQHCLNNLVQQSVFNTIELAEIAQELDKLERSCFDESPGSPRSPLVSGNVDNSGNFSITVLSTALMRAFGIELISWTSAEGRERCSDVQDQTAFLVHNASAGHWFAVRKIGQHWWNLDSLLDAPEHISPFYLDAYMNQLRYDNNTIFIAKGSNWPRAGQYAYNPNDNPNIIWYREEDLLNKAKYNRTDQRTTSRRAQSSDLAGGPPQNDSTLTGNVASYLSNFMGSMFPQGGEDSSLGNNNNYVGGFSSVDEDDELARAIAASLRER
jgi:ataxin-3